MHCKKQRPVFGCSGYGSVAYSQYHIADGAPGEDAGHAGGLCRIRLNKEVGKAIIQWRNPVTRPANFSLPTNRIEHHAPPIALAQIK